MAAAPDPDKLLHGRRVLVVEDDAFVAFDIMKTLREAGAEILGPAFSLARALELVTTEGLDCAILDVMLHDGSVFPAVRPLRQQGAGLVFYTGRFDLSCLKRAWPGALVLLKPAAPSLLVQAVRTVCSRQAEPHLMTAPPPFKGPPMTGPSRREAR